MFVPEIARVFGPAGGESANELTLRSFPLSFPRNLFGVLEYMHDGMARVEMDGFVGNPWCVGRGAFFRGWNSENADSGLKEGRNNSRL